MLRIFMLCSFLTMCVQVANAQTINTSASEVTFSISNMGVRTVQGSFGGMHGTISFSPSAPTEGMFNVCIDASSVNTDNEDRDAHLKNEDFFAVDTYPTICFMSTAIEKTEAGFKATGKLTMHGTTNTVQIPFTYDGTTFIGSLTIDRTDYNVGSSGGFMVGKEVALTIRCKTN